MFLSRQKTTFISSFLFDANSFWRTMGNFALFRNRGVAGQLVSMHQSGTHWLKHIIACALAHQYDIPDPEYNHANDIFGGARDQVVYPEIPRLVSSHSYPHPITICRLVHTFYNLPAYVLLVRDIRYSLVSNYVKWSGAYNVPFSTYLRSEANSKSYNSDIWWAMRFLNSWGLVYKYVPSRVMIVRYEELLEEPATEIRRIDEFWNLGLSSKNIEYGISRSDKAKMAKKDDPNRPKGAVRESDNLGLTLFSSLDRAYFQRICETYLRFSGGYKYSNW